MIASVSLFTNRKRTVPRREASVQAEIVRCLRIARCTVLITSEHRKAVRCPQCAKVWTPAGGRGCSAGIPDLIVTRPSWPRGSWLGLEVKGSRTALSVDQKQLRDEGRIHIVRSAAEAIAAVDEYEAFVKRAQVFSRRGRTETPDEDQNL